MRIFKFLFTSAWLTWWLLKEAGGLLEGTEKQGCSGGALDGLLNESYTTGVLEAVSKYMYKHVRTCIQTHPCMYCTWGLGTFMDG